MCSFFSEATTRFELVIEVLQTFALPLGYGTDLYRNYSKSAAIRQDINFPFYPFSSASAAVCAMRSPPRNPGCRWSPESQEKASISGCCASRTT